MSITACTLDLLRIADLFSHVITRTLSERLVSEVSEDHVSVAQLSAIRFVRLHERVRMGDLASGLMISYPSATNMVNRLERHGLVMRCINPADHREVEVRLTAEGKAVADRVDAERLDRLEAMVASMPESDSDALYAGLYSFIATVVGRDPMVAQDVCLRCGTRAGSGCPVATMNPDAPCR